MGKITGFKEWSRQPAPKSPAAERVGHFAEFIAPQPEGKALEQAGRCMDCGVPFCMQGCPLGNQIPDWNDMVFRGRWESAWRALNSTNNFPEFTGRLCPAPCEGACVLGINDDAVTIEQTEKEIVERAFAEGWVDIQGVAPRHATGKHVAVVGSGPTGLAAAVQLRRAGHQVTVFEKDDRVGGLLRYGIPDFKLDKTVIDRRVALLKSSGVAFRTGVTVGEGEGEGISWVGLKAQHDAVLVAIGAQRARDLEVPGRDLEGVHRAMAFLTQQNRRVASLDVPEDQSISAEGKRVIILGGGDTGSDCLGTSTRQGAKSVVQMELMPAPPETRDASNPWPQWPMIFRTSSSQQEGGERAFAMMTTRLTGKDGKLTTLHAVPVAPETGDDGRTKMVPQGDEVAYPCDLLLLAMGFIGPITQGLVDDLGVALDPRGNIAVDRDYRTSVSHLYAAGDAHRGASLIVWGIAEGREAARTIDQDLMGQTSLPTRGDDRPFGGR